MSPTWQVVVVTGWALILLNLLLVLRVVRWVRSVREVQQLDDLRAELPELAIGEPAPDFQTRNLTGKTISLADYHGQETALVFVSPHCGPCRGEVPALNTLADLARKRAGAQIVLVTEVGSQETQNWLSQIEHDNSIQLTMSTLLASRNTSSFHATYNPRAITPYYCHIDKAGTVTARGGLHSPGWAAIVAGWSGASRTGRNSSRFR